MQERAGMTEVSPNHRPGRQMEFFANIAYRWKKSKKVRKLQLMIAPLGPRGVVTDILGGTGGRDAALEDYLDLCMADGGVARVMRKYNLTREDLVEFYERLCMAGLGQWINGHFVALSALAYPEPLQHLAESRRRMQMLGTEDSSRWLTIGADLMAYWAGDSPLTRIR